MDSPPYSPTFTTPDRRLRDFATGSDTPSSTVSSPCSLLVQPADEFSEDSFYTSPDSAMDSSFSWSPVITVDCQSPAVTVDSQSPAVTVDSQSPAVTVDLTTPNAPNPVRTRSRINETTRRTELNFSEPEAEPVFGKTFEEDHIIQYDDQTEDAIFNDLIMLDKEIIIRIGNCRYVKCTATKDNVYVQVGSVINDNFTSAIHLMPAQVASILHCFDDDEKCDGRDYGDYAEHHCGYGTVVRENPDETIVLGELLHSQDPSMIEGIYFKRNTFTAFIAALREIGNLFTRCRDDILCKGHQDTRDSEMCPACNAFPLSIRETDYFYKY